MVPLGEYYCNGCGHQPPASVSQTDGPAKRTTAAKERGRDVLPSDTFKIVGKRSKLAAAFDVERQELQRELQKAKQQASEARKAAQAMGAPAVAFAPDDADSVGASKEMQSKITAVKNKMRMYKAIEEDARAVLQKNLELGIAGHLEELSYLWSGTHRRSASSTTGSTEIHATSKSLHERVHLGWIHISQHVLNIGWVQSSLACGRALSLRL